MNKAGFGLGITIKSQQQERVLQLQLACAWHKQQLQQLAFKTGHVETVC